MRARNSVPPELGAPRGSPKQSVTCTNHGGTCESKARLGTSKVSYAQRATLEPFSNHLEGAGIPRTRQPRRRLACIMLRAPRSGQVWLGPRR